MSSLFKSVSGTLQVQAFDSRQSMARQAASDIGDAIRRCQAASGPLRMVFAAAPSQQETLAALAQQGGIDWSGITAFHMDEYIGLAADAPQGFGNWLQHHFFSHLPFAQVHLLQPNGADGAAHSVVHYAALLAAAPIDIICMGIGVNGHLAFNDPPVADFDDPQDVKLVELDAVCRQQQVDDACFARLDQVPTHAVTLTIPRLLRCGQIFCIVPGAAKREAVRSTLYDPMTTATPATILRGHPACKLYLDADSAQGLGPGLGLGHA